MGRLQLVGSIKLQVSFAEYRLFYRALLQKRPIILSILRTVATPYLYYHKQMYVYTLHKHVYICTHTTISAYVHVCTLLLFWL